MRVTRLLVPLLVLLASCGGSEPTAPRLEVACGGEAVVALAPGQFTVVDPGQSNGCVRLPASDPSGAEYLLAALATSTQIAHGGTRTSYRLAAGDEATPTPAAPARDASPATGLHRSSSFDAMLRARGRALASRPELFRRPSNGPRAAAAPPILGEQRSFNVCGGVTCNSFVDVTATAVHVGAHGAIFLDDAAPPNGYTQGDIDQLGSLFDNYMYALDTTSFGREPDLDNNGVVIILLSPAVNRLSGHCNQTQTVILGFFLPNDLALFSPGSNGGEIFYSLVPDPTNASCTITRSFALGFIGPTFLHEFQHMISFGRHVLLAGGASEDNWVDEGLSRLAEELGGRAIPDNYCQPFTCLSEYASGDLYNAFTYLDPDTMAVSFLVEPDNIDGSLADNGANWLFLRWLADHFATDSIYGTELTRALDGADAPGGRFLTGGQNVSAVIGVDMATLESEWQLANYAEALPGFTEPTGLLRYKSWDLASAFARLGAYPLVPDSVSTGRYNGQGVLRAGSAKHLRVIQNGTAPGVDVRLTRDGSHLIDGSFVPRIGVLRIR